jgi:hypothetical protein
MDCGELFAPVAKKTMLLTLLHCVAARDWHCHVIDFKTAFLNGILEEEIYIEQPLYFGDPGTILRLNKALYALKQAPRQWYKTLKAELVKQGCRISLIDAGLAKLQRRKCESVYILLYVDDLLLAGRDNSMINLLKKALLSAFDGTDKGEIHHFLGTTIHRNRRLRTLYIDQTKFVKDLLEKTSMHEANGKYIPMQKDRKRKEKGPPLNLLIEAEAANYRSIVGELLYVSTTSRPNIAYAVGTLSRHMKAPAGCHMDQAKYLLRYLITTQDFGLVWGGVKEPTT